MVTTYDFDSLLEYEDETLDHYLDFDNSFDLFDDDLDYSVIGPTDDRFRVRAQSRKPSTLLFPFNSVCLLERRRRVGSRLRKSIVTGTLIAPQVVLTAKHCLMRLSKQQKKDLACKKSTKTVKGTFYPVIKVIPGADLQARNLRLKQPAKPRSMSVRESRFRVSSNLDYGVIILPRPFRKPDRFMMLQPRSDRKTKTLLTIAGYPCDKQKGTMWAHSERIRDVSSNHLRYPIDTCPGHSGSPIWLLGNDGIRLLLGIHTTGPSGCDNDPKAGRQCRRTGAPVTPYTGTRLNCGVRITCEVIDQIIRWCREFGVQEPSVDWRTYRRRCP